MHGAFNGVRRVLPVQQTVTFMGFPPKKPTDLYIDNKSVYDVIDSNRMTPRCRHLDIPIAYLQQEKGKTFNHKLVKTQQMLADFGTKPLVTNIHNRFKYWATGAKFLPTKGTEHYNLLHMEYYEKNFVDILKSMKQNML